MPWLPTRGVNPQSFTVPAPPGRPLGCLPAAEVPGVEVPGAFPGDGACLPARGAGLGALGFFFCESELEEGRGSHGSFRNTLQCSSLHVGIFTALRQNSAGLQLKLTCSMNSSLLAAGAGRAVKKTLCVFKRGRREGKPEISQGGKCRVSHFPKQGEARRLRLRSQQSSAGCAALSRGSLKVCVLLKALWGQLLVGCTEPVGALVAWLSRYQTWLWPSFHSLSLLVVRDLLLLSSST